MSYSMGWWDFIDGAEPAMVHRFTGERLVRRGPLPATLAPTADWLRFDYISTALRYPLAIQWNLQRGQLVVDHNRSAQLWQKDTGSPEGVPRWGTYVRVDDFVADALWCWPGVLDVAFAQGRHVEAHTGGSHKPERFPGSDTVLAVFRIGGYSNGQWRPDLIIEDVIDMSRCRLRGSFGIMHTIDEFAGVLGFMDIGDEATFRQRYAASVQTTQRLLSRPGQVGPSQWYYVAPQSLTEAETVAFVEMHKPSGSVRAMERSAYPRIAVRGVAPHVKRGANEVFGIHDNDSGASHTGGALMWFMMSPGLDIRFQGSRSEFAYVGGPFSGRKSCVALMDFDGYSFAGEAGEVTSSDFLRTHAHERAPFLLRDYTDALLEWRDVDQLIEASGPAAVDMKTRFNVVGSFTRFLGGKPIGSRGQLVYFNDFT